MRKSIFVLALVGLLSVSAAAQTAAADIFGGYSYGRYEGGTNANGWNAAVTGNVTSGLGVTADFSGHYWTSANERVSNHTFMFGPRISGAVEGVRPFAHFLFGGSRLGSTGVSDTAFSMALGGGLDVGGGPVALRLFQADYLITRFGSSRQDNFRLGVGIVIRAGER